MSVARVRARVRSCTCAARAPGQEARVGLDVLDQRVHSRRLNARRSRTGQIVHGAKIARSPNVDRREPQSLSRLLHRGALRGRDRARGLGSEGDPRRPRAASPKPTSWCAATSCSCIGAHITPLPTASTHVNPDPTRTRKLLLHAEEIKRLIGKVEQRGYTLVPLNLHYTKGRIKLEIGLGARQAQARQARRRAGEGVEPREAAAATQPLISSAAGASAQRQSTSRPRYRG